MCITIKIEDMDHRIKEKTSASLNNTVHDRMCAIAYQARVGCLDVCECRVFVLRASVCIVAGAEKVTVCLWKQL